MSDGRDEMQRRANEAMDVASNRRGVEMAKLRARIEKLEAALREIANRRDYQLPSSQDIARAALGEKA